MEKKLFGLREATTALGILPQNGSNWLSALELTNGQGKTRRLQLDRPTCLILLVCQRLSTRRQLDFEDGKIMGLLRYVLLADPELESDLRLSKVALSLSMEGAQEVAIASSDVDVLLRHQAPFNDGIKWIPDAVATHQLCLSTFALWVLYDLVDELFLSEQELAEKKDPWLKFGVKSQVE